MSPYVATRLDEIGRIFVMSEARRRLRRRLGQAARPRGNNELLRVWAKSSGATRYSKKFNLSERR